MPALNFGSESYFIVGEQTTWGTPVSVPASMVQTVYEPQSSTLRRLTTPLTPTRLKRNPSPVRNSQGMVSCGGDLVFQLHKTDMGVWLKHLLMDSSIATVANAAAEVHADQAYTSSPFAPDSQPDAVLTEPIDAGRLDFTFTGASGSGTITITGRDHNDLRISETITVSSPGNHVSSFFYKDNVNITISSGITGGTVQIDADPQSYTHTLSLEGGILEGLTVEMVKGVNTPTTYDSLIVTQAVLTLADIPALACSLIGRDGDDRRGIEGNATPTDISGFAQINQLVTPNWGMAIEVDGTQYRVASASATINNNIDFPTTRFACDIHLPKPVRKGERSMDLAATIDYTNANDFDAKALGTQIAAKFSAVDKPKGGQYTSIEFDFPQAELVGFPDPEVPDQSEITQDLAIRAITGASGNDELTAKVITPDATIP